MFGSCERSLQAFSEFYNLVAMVTFWFTGYSTTTWTPMQVWLGDVAVPVDFSVDEILGQVS